jgi:hypothetical protein
VRSVFFSAVAISLLASACSDGSGPGSAGPPTTIAAASATTLDGAAGTVLPAPISVKVSDAQGKPVPLAKVNFVIASGGGSLSAASDTTDSAGMASVTWTLGQSLGPSRVEARVQGVVVPAVFNATIKAGAATAMQRVSNPPGSSAGGFELADSVAIRVTDNFGNAVGETQVTFTVAAGGGTVSPATVTTSSTGTARTSWKLGTSGAQQLRASAGAIQATVDATAASCTETQIAPGSVLTIGPVDPKCVVLSGTASRYFVTVVNAAPSVGSTNAFRMRGLGAGTGTTSGDVAAARTASTQGLSAAAAAAIDEMRDRQDAHDVIMRANERVMQEMLPKLSARASLRMNSVQPAAAPNVGDIINLRIPNINNLCSATGGNNVAARVVFVGQHGVMLEDTLSPTRGQLDSLYTLTGQEFDTNMWTILNSNFGNPLAMDAQTDNNQKFFMLFSQVINTLEGGSLAGFVASSDFFPQSTCPGSNLAEIFYARVPTVVGSGTGSGTAADWYRRTRTVMIHEVKHIVSFAERFAHGFTPTSAFNNADRWLEESSAMMAEELWARTQYNYQSKANVTYAQSVGCEVRPNGSTNPTYGNCGLGKPLSMFDHFILLNDYETDVERLSPLGATSGGDFSFYGSGWNFLRWVVDTYATSESGFLTALVQDFTNPGVQNLEARTGRPFADLVNDWAVGLVMDDYPGFTPANPKHQIASWNVRDIFAGMNTDFSNQGFFTRAVPLLPRAASFGKFSIDVSSVQGGSMAVFEVTGTQTNRQMFEFNGSAGTSFPADMRVNIIRVQ